MNQEKRNPANQLTREYMVLALMKLLEYKPLSTISISEITKKAGVSRMTYYRNYASKEEIFKSHLEDIFASYKKDISVWTPKGRYDDMKHMQHCFQYFYSYKDFIRCLIKSGLGDLVRNALSAYMIETYYSKNDDVSTYYTLQAFAGSLYNIYIAWIDRDNAEPASKMASIMHSIYNPASVMN
ncbi:MAG TPA: TetR/AcrR family transcriptional regulator [Lachnospiraceae bacterium]|nr:TetR/AcrR family transcriptional regulator [Lachnospiraceae bacterium]